jgi:hypothetical protein
VRSSAWAESRAHSRNDQNSAASVSPLQILNRPKSHLKKLDLLLGLSCRGGWLGCSTACNCVATEISAW